MKEVDPIFAAALTRLQADPESLPAGERRDLATHLGRAWATSSVTEESLSLATLLAQDPLPEVRKAGAPNKSGSFGIGGIRCRFEIRDWSPTGERPVPSG